MELINKLLALFRAQRGVSTVRTSVRYYYLLYIIIIIHVGPRRACVIMLAVHVHGAANLLQDLLVTQSEYVKTELLGLKEIMVGLEEKAGNMELKVREAMDDGELSFSQIFVFIYLL